MAGTGGAAPRGTDDLADAAALKQLEQQANDMAKAKRELKPKIAHQGTGEATSVGGTGASGGVGGDRGSFAVAAALAVSG